MALRRAAGQSLKYGDLDHTVAHYLPDFAANGKESVTVRMLLTHTSGFASWSRCTAIPPTSLHASTRCSPSRWRTRQERPTLYDDLNLITLGALVEHLPGEILEELVVEGITEPLAFVDTGYNPPEEKLQRIAATE